MARDAEKARSMLHRFLSQKAEEEGDGTSIRGSGIGGPKRVQVRVVTGRGGQRGREAGGKWAAGGWGGAVGTECGLQRAGQ